MGGFFGVAWNINQVSLRQAITPPRMQGRMNATMRFIVWGTIPLGAIIGGALGDLIGLHATIWVGAIGGLLAFLPVALSSVRQIVTMPEPAEDDAPGTAEPAASPRDRRATRRALRPSSIGIADAALAGDVDRALVAGVDVAHDAHARVGRQHALQLARRELGAVGDAHHAGVLAVADAHAAAVVDRHPGRARRRC